MVIIVTFFRLRRLRGIGKRKEGEESYGEEKKGERKDIPTDGCWWYSTSGAPHATMKRGPPPPPLLIWLLYEAWPLAAGVEATISLYLWWRQTLND